MKAMCIHAGVRRLFEEERPTPVPGPGEVLVEVAACGVCRTDLHILDGELAPRRESVVPGHEVVGRVAALGPGARRFAIGDRVGIPWLAGTCGTCEDCVAGRENLCARAAFTGYDRDGGYAEWATADERFVLPIPGRYSDEEAAPLLCAGLIGYRAYAMAPEARRLGLYGFGAAAHVIAQVAVHEGREVFAFTRAGDAAGQAFARSLGCAWAGGSGERPPVPLDAALLFAPVGALVPAALAAVRPGATVVCAGIHMSDIPAFPYALLWGERSVRSVANLTRVDGERFMAIAGRVPIRVATRAFALGQAGDALEALRRGAIEGAAVLTSVKGRARPAGSV